MNFTVTRDDKFLPIITTWIICFLLFVLVVAGMQQKSSYGADLVFEKAKLKIIPLIADSIGVDPKSEFQVICYKKISQAELLSSFTVTPPQPHQITQTAENKFLIKFAQPLKQDTVYKFAFMDRATGQNRSWAFQTKKAFRITGTLPDNESTGVPVDTGIEIRFSHDNFNDIKDYFEITPKVEGRFEKHKKTAVFVPQGLAEGTIYTVKIKKGISLSGSNERIEEDHVFQFETETKHQEDDNYLDFEELNNVLPNTSQAIKAYASLTNPESEFDVEIYKYHNEKTFISNMQKIGSAPGWMEYAWQEEDLSTTGLEKVGSFKTKLLNKEEQDFLVLPAPLAEGHYLIKCSLGEIKAQTHLQVNRLVSYITVASNKTVAWVNDGLTGQAVENCTASMENLPAVKTNREGLAVIPGSLPGDKDQSTFICTLKSAGNPSFIAFIQHEPYYYGDNWYEDYESYNSDDYFWNYLFTDRGLYMPTDTVKVWGVIKPKRPTGKPLEVVLELGQEYYEYEYEGEMVPIATKEVRLSPSGSFTGEFVLPNLMEGSYDIAAKVDGKVISTRYIEVRKYTKPAYQLEVTANKKAIFAWEKAKINILTKFFEGTPVSGLELDYEYDYTSFGEEPVDGRITCDNKGSASLTIHPPSTGDGRSEPKELYYHINNASAEEEEINAEDYLTVFPRDTMITMETFLKDKEGGAKVRANKIDLTALNQGSEEGYDPEIYRGKPVNMNLQAKVYEFWWETKVTGKYYDFINKRTENTYEYYKVEELRQTIDLETKDGFADFKFPVKKGKYYRVELTGYDGRGQRITEEQYVFDTYDYDPEEALGQYNLTEESPKEFYQIGDKVSLTATYENKPLIMPAHGKILYFVFKNGLLSHATSSKPKCSLTFAEEHVPNVFVKAVYFNGNSLADIGMRKIDFNPAQKKLQINVKTNKKEYAPGEKVVVDFTVKDAQGEPVKTWLNLSVVDEAFFAICDQEVDLLSNLYEPYVSSGLVTEYLSYEGFRVINGAEQGEGDDESGVRSTLNDTAFFHSVETGSDGKGHTSFTLPDNLTSWRLTYQGVTKDLKAGSGKTKISAKLPFFVDVIFNNVFLAGDTPSITVRSFGTDIDSQETVNYKAYLEEGKGRKVTFNQKGRGSEFAHINLGRLDEGECSVTVEASQGKLKDAKKIRFQVVQSLLQTTRASYSKLGGAFKPEKRDSLTTLYFYNSDSSLFYEALQYLAGSWGERVDQKMASQKAMELMKKYYREDFYGDVEFDGSKYQKGDGGIALLSYDQSDPELSAKLCSLDKDSFDKNALKNYFYSILADYKATPEAVTASYWGLGALSEPVLVEVQALVKSDNLDLKQRIYLSLSLAELGDLEGAREVYEQILSEKARSSGSYLYIRYGDRDDSMEVTSLLSVLSAKLNAKEQDKLFNYVHNTSTNDILVNIERLMYVSKALPNTKQVGTFRYEIDGVKKEITLNTVETFTLPLTPDKAARIKFSNVHGDITVAESYLGSVLDLVDNSNQGITLTRNYSVEGKTGNLFAQSDLIQITLEVSFAGDCPEGWYELTDTLPSGLRFVSRMPEEPTDGWLYLASGQKVVFGVDTAPGRKQILTYYARAVSKGAFTADHAIVKHDKSNTMAFAGRAQLIIK